MKQIAFYVPELDAITIQWMMKDCELVFEWHHADLHECNIRRVNNPYLEFCESFILLGEL